MALPQLRFSLPDFAEGFDLNHTFAELVTRNPMLLKEGIVLDSVYGCFPNCNLNGGRAYVREPFSQDQVEGIFQAFAELGIRLRLTLTNMLATEDDLHDPYANMILETGSRYGAEAIVYSDFVGDFVREQYGMPITLSTTREITDIAEFNRMTERYDLVVLNYNFNKDRVFIDAITHKDRVEVMVNEYCEHSCPRRHDHYLHNSQDQVNLALTSYDCRADKINTFLRHKPGDPVFFTDDEVGDLAQETGIANYKIVGRGIPFDIRLESYVYYLIDPTYREDVRGVVRSMVCG